MISIVLDTNAFVSGIFWFGPPHRILMAWQQGAIEIITSQDIISEYARVGEVLARDYKNVDISAFIELITINSTIINPLKLQEQVSADPDDEKFIECALSAECKLIISEDKYLLNISGYSGIDVLKPAAFVKQYLPNAY